MTGRGRVAAGALLVTSTSAVLFLATTGMAGAQAPDVSAWWNIANAGDPAPQPPAPPDVPAGDLLVEGSNGLPGGTLPVGGPAPTGAQAIAGLVFALGPTDIVGSLTLTIDGTPPPQVSIVACRATESFTNEDNGVWGHVPAYDGEACVPGKLKGSTVVFDSVSRLVAPGRLAVVLLPGAVDRVVFKKPSRSSLQVTSPGGLGPAAPPIGSDNGSGTGSGTGSGAGGGGGARSGGGNAAPPEAPVGGSPVVPPAGDSTSTTGGAGDVPPVVAGQPGSTPPTAAPASPAAATSGWSTDRRRLVAAIVLALETLGFVLFTRSSEPPPVVPLGVATAGGRFRPPDRTLPGGRAAGGAVVGGVGRFRRERTGRPPQV